MYRIFLMFTVLSAAVLSMISCKSSRSDLDISNGIPTNAYKRVVRIYGPEKEACTATIISHNTVLTAAHCLIVMERNDKGNAKISVQLSDTKYASSRKYMFNPKADLDNMSTLVYDVAVVVFDDNTFDFAPLKIVDYHPQPFDRVTMVGFGCLTTSEIDESGSKKVICDDSRDYTKRYGRNHIYAIDQGSVCNEGMIQVNQKHAFVDSESTSPTGEDTIMWKADSGGPLLLDSTDTEEYKLIGIASYADGDYMDNRFGCYSSPTNPENISFLKEAVSKIGASIDFE